MLFLISREVNVASILQENLILKIILYLDSIISTYERSKTRMFHEFLSKQQYTGRPSVNLRDLPNLASKLNVGEDIVCLGFLDALPSAVRPILATQNVTFTGIAWFGR